MISESISLTRPRVTALLQMKRVNFVCLTVMIYKQNLMLQQAKAYTTLSSVLLKVFLKPRLLALNQSAIQTLVVSSCNILANSLERIKS